MIGRLVQATDFRRLLASPAHRRTAHFAVHYLRSAPAHAWSAKLCTPDAPSCPEAVDDSGGRRWLGCLVPKRHARRSVTRSVLKRQIRAAVVRHQDRLPGGLWLVRLRSPFVPAQFPSADSGALRQAARQELDELLSRAAP